MSRTREGDVSIPGRVGSSGKRDVPPALCTGVCHAPGLCRTLPWDMVLWQPMRHVPLLPRGLRSDGETDNTCTHELTCPMAKATVKTSQADTGRE